MENRAATSAQPGTISVDDIALGSALRMSAANDPEAMVREADIYFGERQYAEAAELYARLLKMTRSSGKERRGPLPSAGIAWPCRERMAGPTNATGACSVTGRSVSSGRPVRMSCQYSCRTWLG